MRDFDGSNPYPQYWNQQNQFPYPPQNQPFNSCMQQQQPINPSTPPLPNVGTTSNAKIVNREKAANTRNNENNLDFMQTQNHIFVFSTVFANQAAEAVLNGLHSSMVSYHRSQPGTKAFLERHPIKPNQLDHTNATMQWMTNSTTKGRNTPRSANSKVKKPNNKVKCESPSFQQTSQYTVNNVENQNTSLASNNSSSSRSNTDGEYDNRDESNDNDNKINGTNNYTNQYNYDNNNIHKNSNEYYNYSGGDYNSNAWRT